MAVDGEKLTIDMEDGYTVTMRATSLTLDVPDYGLIRVSVQDGRVITELPPGRKPDWLRATSAKFDARPDLSRRVQVSRAKMEVHRYFAGWENFFFPFRSPLSVLTAGELLDLALSDEELEPGTANWLLILDTFWTNPDWQHGNVFVALLETLLMAVLGTFTAVFVALPLAFLAARNFTPSGPVRFFVRRLFDFVRGIDMLIWSLIFIRSFGLGPLTGALAIAFTDTGTLGKLFSEALENIDRRQVEGERHGGLQAAELPFRCHPADPADLHLAGVLLSGIQHSLRHRHRCAGGRGHRADAGGDDQDLPRLGEHALHHHPDRADGDRDGRPVNPPAPSVYRRPLTRVGTRACRGRVRRSHPRSPPVPSARRFGTSSRRRCTW